MIWRFKTTAKNRYKIKPQRSNKGNKKAKCKKNNKFFNKDKKINGGVRSNNVCKIFD